VVFRCHITIRRLRRSWLRGLEADVLVDLDPVAQLGGHVIDIFLHGLIRVLDERLFQHAVGMLRPCRRSLSRI